MPKCILADPRRRENGHGRAVAVNVVRIENRSHYQFSTQVLTQCVDKYIVTKHGCTTALTKDKEMKAQYLYLTEWSPNGTNDLLICDENDHLIACVPEATFGFNVFIDHRISTQPFFFDDYVAVCEPGYAYDIGGCLVAEVSIQDVLKRICVSPMSDGSEVINELKRLGLLKVEVA